MYVDMLSSKIRREAEAGISTMPGLFLVSHALIWASILNKMFQGWGIGCISNEGKFKIPTSQQPAKDRQIGAKENVRICSPRVPCRKSKIW